MKILLVTPPLTQLNTPYPATACLTGFLKNKGHEVKQVDLGIELISQLFTEKSLREIFSDVAENQTRKMPKNIRQILSNAQRYCQTIDAVIRFLRGEDPTLAVRICNTDFLPQSARFKDIADTEWAFGSMGFTDHAKYLATLYIEDLTDFIRDTLNPYFGLNKYAEHLCMYMPHFEVLHTALQAPANRIDTMMLDIFNASMAACSPDLVGFSIPFPGNLYAAAKCSQFIRLNYPKTPIVWGGGYANTELRSLSDPKVFDYTHYIVLDDGERNAGCRATFNKFNTTLIFQKGLIKLLLRNLAR